MLSTLYRPGLAMALTSLVVADAVADGGTDWWLRLMRDGVPLALLALVVWWAKPWLEKVLLAQVDLVASLKRHADQQAVRDAERTAAEARRWERVEARLGEIADHTKAWHKCQEFHAETRPVLQELVERLPHPKRPAGGEG